MHAPKCIENQPTNKPTNGDVSLFIPLSNYSVIYTPRKCPHHQAKKTANKRYIYMYVVGCEKESSIYRVRERERHNVYYLACQSLYP